MDWHWQQWFMAGLLVAEGVCLGYYNEDRVQKLLGFFLIFVHCYFLHLIGFW